MRELIPDSSYESTAADFFHWLHNEKIMAQYILFSADEIKRYSQLRHREIIPADGHSVLFVLGRYTKTTHPDSAVLSQYLNAWNRKQGWMVCAFGQHEFECLQSAVKRGGHIRVGFENCLLTRNGTVAESNLELIMQSKKMAAELNRPLANSEQTRIMLGAR